MYFMIVLNDIWKRQWGEKEFAVVTDFYKLAPESLSIMFPANTASSLTATELRTQQNMC